MLKKIEKRILRSTVYKMLQIRMIHFLSHIWSKEIRFQSYDRILIISPHPDDETIGCAGLIQKILKQQKEVYVLMVTNGEAVWDSSLIDTDELIAKRKESMMKAASIIGLPCDHYIHLEWSDGKLVETIDNPARHLELGQIIDSIKPSIILLPHRFEISEDHSSLTKTLFNSLKINTHKAEIFYYKVHSMKFLHEFILGWRTSFIVSLNKEECEIKQRALDAYIKPTAPFGKSYSGGKIASSLLFTMRWNKELFFKVD